MVYFHVVRLLLLAFNATVAALVFLYKQTMMLSNEIIEVRLSASDRSLRDVKVAAHAVTPCFRVFVLCPTHTRCC
jgi:hypothetical protein